MIKRVSGSALDIGCGIGRTALWARQEGHAVRGVERSPGAIRVTRERGLDRAVVGDMTALGID